MKRIWFYACAAFCAVVVSCGAQTTPAAPATPDAPDYSKAENWVCRPGSEDICTTGLDAVVVYPDGHKVAQPFVPAKNPPIDCFYIYPTVSREQMPLSDLTDSPEIQLVVKAQVGRLSSRCRVFAPVYRQATLYSLRQSLTGGGGMDFKTPLLDVQAAWDYYLAHDNKGRGVVLVGHSQGTILLQSLMEKSIDGTPAQALLVSAFLAGDPSLGVPPGKAVGGTFAHIPVCSAAAQTGCAYVWGTFEADDTSKSQLFGRARTDGLESACVNPAAPAGGSGMLKFYYEKPPTAPANDPPWVEAVDQISGACKADAQGDAFRVSVEPVPSAEFYRGLLKRSAVRAGWGLHVRDIALVQGNMLDVMDAEIAAWRKAH
jgi:hypothetical protein